LEQPDLALDAETLRTADALRRAITNLQRQFRTLRAEHGVSPSKLVILSRLYRAGAPLTAADLARLDRLQPQSLTRAIAELDEAGYLVRRQAETDKRQIMIDITPAGRELLILDARAQTAWLAEQIEQELSGTEQALLALAASLLDRLTDT
jgi:DNA-binding MarR family transcriptional regulator